MAGPDFINIWFVYHLSQQSTLRGGSTNVTLVATSFPFSSIDYIDEKE